MIEFLSAFGAWFHPAAGSHDAQLAVGTATALLVLLLAVDPIHTLAEWIYCSLGATDPSFVDLVPGRAVTVSWTERRGTIEIAVTGLVYRRGRFSASIGDWVIHRRPGLGQRNQQVTVLGHPCPECDASGSEPCWDECPQRSTRPTTWVEAVA